MVRKPIPIPVFIPGYGDVRGLFVEEDAGGWSCIAIGDMQYSYDNWRLREPASLTPEAVAVALLKLYEKIA
jgi:hypothetical protein